MAEQPFQNASHYETPQLTDEPPGRARRRTHFARAALIGLLAGFLAVAFRRALAVSEHSRQELLTRLHAYPYWGWMILPLLGLMVGCAAGWITQRFAPEAGGSGIPHLKGVMLQLRSFSPMRLILVKFFGGCAGIGAGLSLGREGPTVQMGAAVASALAGPLRSPPSDIPQLLSAGAGAGLAAAFNAPLAGLLFVIEELHRELSSRTAAGALVAAVCATVVTQWLAGDTPAFEVRGLKALPLQALPLALVVGLLCGLFGVLFNRAILASQNMALNQQRIPRWALPGVVAAAAGLIAWWLPEAIGGGHSVAEKLLSGRLGMGIGLLVLLMLIKFGLTVTSYATGAPGGIFAPMLLLGALCGTAFARVATIAWPTLASTTQVLAVLGMAAFFVGSVRAPLTGIILISEMTGGYELLFPICIASLAGYLIAEALRDQPIYDALLESDLRRTGQGESRIEPRSIYIGIQNGAALAGKAIGLAGLPRGVLVIGVERGGANLHPSISTVLLPGDHVTMLVPGNQPDLPLLIVRLCTGL